MISVYYAWWTVRFERAVRFVYTGKTLVIRIRWIDDIVTGPRVGNSDAMVYIVSLRGGTTFRVFGCVGSRKKINTDKLKIV